uniref:Uncharacterized protein n=1 Tax=Corethron hystrix TaxID=216773 RepID=A0A7S1BL19_9STRA|mmetsp:Transcript_32692/g.75248  ORF Transcript_32692/g.75248 Transcript_32692/m.75248 type:complete len:125 (+) Transcript_32692:135-509(+)
MPSLVKAIAAGMETEVESSERRTPTQHTCHIGTKGDDSFDMAVSRIRECYSELQDSNENFDHISLEKNNYEERNETEIEMPNSNKKCNGLKSQHKLMYTHLWFQKFIFKGFKSGLFFSSSQSVN